MSSTVNTAPNLTMFRRAPLPPVRNTDTEVDCTPYAHVQYRPFCQTIRLEKRRKALQRERRKKLPTILENLCMFEWLHRVDAHRDLSHEELLFVLTNGLFHQNKGNVAIVFNKDESTGKSATSRMNATFGKSSSRKEAVKQFMKSHKSPKVEFAIPENLKKYGIGNLPRKEKPEVVVKSVEVVTLD